VSVRLTIHANSPGSGRSVVGGVVFSQQPPKRVCRTQTWGTFSPIRAHAATGESDYSPCVRRNDRQNSYDIIMVVRKHDLVLCYTTRNRKEVATETNDSPFVTICPTMSQKTKLRVLSGHAPDHFDSGGHDNEALDRNCSLGTGGDRRLGRSSPTAGFEANSFAGWTQTSGQNNGLPGPSPSPAPASTSPPAVRSAASSVRPASPTRVAPDACSAARRLVHRAGEPRDAGRRAS